MKYKIIYADPAWSYYNDSTVTPDKTKVIGKGMRRPPYPTMSSKDIENLSVKSISDKDCLLFIWTTDYHLEKCLKVIKAWGFEYKTIGFVWAKKNKKGEQVSFRGCYTLKSGCEICLIGAKGKANQLVKKRNVNSFIESPRQEHSKKPDIVRDKIVELCGDIPRVELFARQKVDGWDAMGFDVDGKSIQESIKLIAQ